MAHRDTLRISRESDLRQILALIVGPPGTPYEYGFFEFSVKFPPDYPSKPPKIDAKTTNLGRCRFNPNIYAGGKVCLSILGTWQGETGEQWSSAQGLESVLLSIQSLMSANPYANEPGFEDSRGDKDTVIREAYCAKIQHETLRIAVIQSLESILHIQHDGSLLKSDRSELTQWDTSEDEDEDLEVVSNEKKTTIAESFNDLKKQRFLWYYESYLSEIEKNMTKYADGTEFERMPFESSSNGMKGHFQYGNLGKRLIRIKEVLQEETDSWAMEGLRAVEHELNIAYTLQNHFNQFIDYQKQKNIHNIDVGLLDGNPFVWMITYFGRSGSNLDGGMFKIRMSLSPRFPEERPRVKVETKMYHHRVSRDGILCYFPEKTDEVKYHIAAVVLAIEELSPPYDPRATVNPEATRLFWGNDTDKKKYNRAQRRSAQDSMDEIVT